MIFQKLKEYGISDSVIRKNCIFVTDQGSNLIKALNCDTRLSCSAHILNNVLKNVLENKNTAVRECIDNCKALVTYFVQSGLKNVRNFYFYNLVT